MARSRWPAGIVLTIILILAASLRLPELDAGLWGDEALTRRVGELDLGRAAAAHIYPINYLQAHAALRLGGDEGLLRLPHVIFGLATIAGLFAAAKRTGGLAVGLIATLLMAVLVPHIRICQEVRYYALHTLAGCAFLWCMYRGVTTGKWRYWAGAIAACGVGGLNHLFFVVFAGSITTAGILWVFLSPRIAARRTRWRRVVTLCLCGALGLAPLAGTAIASGAPIWQLVNPSRSESAEQFTRAVAQAEKPPPVRVSAIEWNPLPEDTGPVYCKLTLADYAFLVRSGCSNASSSFAFLVPLAFAAWGFFRLRHRDPALAWLAVSCFVIAPLPFFLLRSTHLFNSRYFSVQQPVMALLMAFGIDGAGQALCHAAQRVGRIRAAQVKEMCRLHRRSVLAAAGLALLIILGVSISQAGLDLALHLLAMVSGPSASGAFPSVMLLFIAFVTILTALGATAGGVVLLGRILPPSGTKDPTRRQAIRSGLGRVLATVCFLLLLAPSTVSALSGYYARPGGRATDWRGGADYMANLITEDDVFVFVKPTEFVRTFSMPLEHYLTERANNGRATVPRLERHFFWELSAARLQAVAAAHPDATIWIVHGTPVTAELESLVDGGRGFGSTMFYYLGEPTENLVENGGFEDPLAAGKLSGSAGIEEAGRAYQGARAIRIGGAGEGLHSVSLPVRCPDVLRNPERDSTLSMVLKYTTDILVSPGSIESEQESPVGVRIDLVGHNVDGTPFERVIVRLRGKRDWHHVAFSIKAGRDFPQEAKGLFVRIGVWGGTGTVWADNVQLETKDHPTPFSDGIRLAHPGKFAALSTGESSL